MKSSRLPALDGLRAVAILFVVVGHAAATIGALQNHRPLEKFIAEAGHLGVDIFFVLSGFLITSLLLAEHQRSGAINLAGFYWRRVRRIFPAYYFFLLVIGGLALAGFIELPLRDWISNVFYLTDYPIGGRTWWTGHAWSLAVEEQFYLIWPAVLVLFGLFGAKRFAVIAIVLLPFVRLATYFKFPALREDISTMLHTRLDVLMVGCLLAILWSESGKPRQWAIGNRGNIIAGIAGVLMLGGLAVESRFGAAYYFTIGYGLTAVCAAILLNYVIARPEAAFARILSLGPVTWLGRISYSLYLWQQPFLTNLNHTVFGRFPLNVLGAVAVACFSYYVIERRFYQQVAVKIDTHVQPWEGNAAAALQPKAT